MRRDDDCGFVRRDIPDMDLPPSYLRGFMYWGFRHARLHRFHFQAPADFKKALRLISKKISKKNAALSLLYCFFFFFFHARHQAGEEPFLKRGEECRKRRFAHGSFLLRELIWKWEHIVVSACSHRKRSNGVIETWVRWVFAVWIIEEVWTLTLIIIGFIGESLMIYDGLGSEDRSLTAWVCRCERLQFGISVPGLVEVGGVCL